MMIRSLLAALAIAVSGCATTTSVVPSGALTGVEAQRAVFAAGAAYTAAQQLAVAYESQPRCVAPVTSRCSDLNVVAQLRRADRAASTALDAAQAVVRVPNISTNAVGLALQTANSALAAFSALLLLTGVPMNSPNYSAPPPLAPSVPTPAQPSPEPSV